MNEELQDQQELIEEKKQLDERIARMHQLMDSEKFIIIPSEDRARVTLQRDFMQKYSDTLGERIRNQDPVKDEEGESSK